MYNFLGNRFIIIKRNRYSKILNVRTSYPYVRTSYLYVRTLNVNIDS